MKEFSENLKRIREEKGFSRSYMAKELGVTLPAYSAYENGKEIIGDREPSLDNLAKIAKLLNISIDELMGFRRDDFEHYKILWEKAGYIVDVENSQISIHRDKSKNFSKFEQKLFNVEKFDIVNELINNGGFVCPRDYFISVSRQAENETLENILPIVEKNNILNIQSVFINSIFESAKQYFEKTLHSTATTT